MRMIFAFLGNMLPYLLLAAPLIAVCRLACCLRLKRQGGRTTIWHEVGCWIFWLFLAGLLSQTVIPRFAVTPDGALIGLIGGADGWNLIPFRTIAQMLGTGGVRGFWVNIVGNILMFAPIGFFPPLLWRGISWKRAVLLTALFSLGVELCQLLLPRVTDIDDLILNTCGGLLGAGMFCLLRRLTPGFVEKCRVVRPQ